MGEVGGEVQVRPVSWGVGTIRAAVWATRAKVDTATSTGQKHQRGTQPGTGPWTEGGRAFREEQEGWGES